MARNDTALVDGDGVTSDWIELHNAGDDAVDLAGWHLTDERSRLDKWTFPADRPSLTVLGPGEYRVVFASGRLNENGETVGAYVDHGGHLHVPN